MAGSTDSPALPWGSSGVPATGAIDVGFEQTMRKFLLATVMEKMDERTGGSQLGAVAEGLSSEPDSAELQAILADPPVGLTAGKRIEVRWQLTDEHDKSTEKWWGAALLEPKQPEAGEPSDEHFPAWAIRYDKHGSFEEEESQTVFVSRRWLLHENSDEPLVWRAEGEAWEPDPDEESDEEAAAAAAGSGADGGSQTPADGAEAEEPPAKRMKDVLHQTLGRATRAYEDQLGCSIEAAAMQRMQSTMSLQQQQVVATGFSKFTDHLVSKLKQTVEECGDSREITVDDVQEILASFKRKRGDD